MRISKNTILATLLSVVMLAIVFTPVLAAVEVGEGLADVKTETGYSDTSLTVVIGKIIKVVLGFLGLICLLLFIIGGFKWMVSSGNEEKIAEAKKLMSAAVVGLFIIIIAYAATNFIVSKVMQVTAPGQ